MNATRNCFSVIYTLKIIVVYKEDFYN